MFQIIKAGTVIPFMKIKTYVEVFCLLLVIGSIVAMGVKGLNWGLDFTGGVVVETKYTQGVDLEKVKEEYDFIIIDCPPALGMLTVNAMTAANTVIVPIQCEFYALDGLTQLIYTIELIQKSLN